MSFYLTFEEACVVGFFVWLAIKILNELWGLAVAGTRFLWDRAYYRIWAWKARPRKTRRN